MSPQPPTQETQLLNIGGSGGCVGFGLLANVDVLRYLPDISHLGDRKHICKSNLQRAIFLGSVERVQYLSKQF